MPCLGLSLCPAHPPTCLSLVLTHTSPVLSSIPRSGMDRSRWQVKRGKGEKLEDQQNNQPCPELCMRRFPLCYAVVLEENSRKRNLLAVVITTSCTVAHPARDISVRGVLHRIIQRRGFSVFTTPAQRAPPGSGAAPRRPSASSYEEAASWAGASSRARARAHRRWWGLYCWYCCRCR